MDTRFLRRVTELACLGFLFGASIFPAAAQEGPKLYVFTSGSLGGFPKAALGVTSAPVMRAAGSNVELAQMSFGFPPAAPRGGPVFNFRSEGRSFRFASSRCASGCVY